MFRLRREVYLDNNATTPVSAHVRKRMNQVLRRYYGNPSSLYRAARDSAIILEDSRETVARSIGAEPGEIVFTGSATEANNTALAAAFEDAFPRRKKIVSTPIEHASVLSTLEYLKSRGAEIVFCPVDRKGRLDLAALEEAVDENTLLVCTMLANNEIGTVQDVAAIARIAHQPGALMLADCVQALAKIPVDVGELGVDYASFSAHKIHGPKGVGCLYARTGSPLTPFIHGGHQETGLRAGTESLHNIAGFAAACEQIDSALERAAEVGRLKRQLAERLRAAEPEIVVSSPREGCLPNTLNVVFPGTNNALLMAGLDDQGISVSAGSACDTQEDAPSHVLEAIGLSDEQARQTLRISLSTDTSERDVAYAGRAFCDLLSGKADTINVLTPAQVGEKILFDDRTYILDVRWALERKLMKGLPNSHEIVFLKARKYFSQIPRDRNILVVCQSGPNAPFVAYQLRSRGFRNVSFLLTGVTGWRLARPDLFEKYAGQNVTALELA